jgi:hypothetical protein
LLRAKARWWPLLASSPEACCDGEIFDKLYDALEFNREEMSQSDWDLSGCPSGEPSKQLWDAMEQAFELLNRETGKLWNALLVEARGLIVRSMHSMKGGSSGPPPRESISDNWQQSVPE